MRQLFLLALVACNGIGTSDIVAQDGPGGSDTNRLDVTAAPAVDPLRGDLPWSVTGADGTSVTVSILSGETVLFGRRRSLKIKWPGQLSECQQDAPKQIAFPALHAFLDRYGFFGRLVFGAAAEAARAQGTAQLSALSPPCASGCMPLLIISTRSRWRR